MCITPNGNTNNTGFHFEQQQKRKSNKFIQGRHKNFGIGPRIKKRDTKLTRELLALNVKETFAVENIRQANAFRNDVVCVCLLAFFPQFFFYIKFIYRFIFNQLYMANCRQNAQQRFALNILQQKQHVTCNKIKMNTYTRIHIHMHTLCIAQQIKWKLRKI